MASPLVRFEQYTETEDIEEYFERLELFLDVNGVRDEQKVPRVLSDMGARTYAVLKNLLAPSTPKDSSLATIKEKLIEYYKPKPPVISQRYVFQQREQKEGETINEFVIELRRLARTCQYGQFLDDALRDRFVCGISNHNTRRKLLAEKELTLKRAIEVAVAAEMAVLQSDKNLAPPDQQLDLCAVRQICRCCGKQGHKEAVCRFRTRNCFKCGKKGHLQSVCKGVQATPKSEGQLKPKAANHIEGDDTCDFTDDLSLWTVTGGHSEGYHVYLRLNNKPVQMELDTGAAVSVISEHEWNRLFPSTLLSNYEGSPLRGYSGCTLQVKGQCMMKVEYKEQKLYLPLVVIAGHQRPALLGRNWLSVLKLDWTQLNKILHSPMERLLARFSHVFKPGVGTIVGYQADVRLKEGTKPVFKKCRSVAYALQPLLDAELTRLQSEGILEPVQTSKWATPLVVVPKANGKIRVCGDYKVTINKYVETKTYPLPTIEDILARLAGGCYFTKLDLSQAYQQLPLDKDSKELLVVNTPKGLFQYTRLPYGVSTAPAIFQAVMDRILQGLPVACYLDDILVAGRTQEEHDENLQQVLERLEKAGIRLHKEKCQFSQPEVEYLGHCINSRGVHPTAKKLEAIKNAPVPTDVSQLRAFVGLMNYYGKFIPQLSTQLAPLYKLLEKDQEWEWSEECQSTFHKCQSLLSSDAVLVHYDTNKPLRLACDASSYGLGVVLSHVLSDGEHPIAYASRTLTKAERNYGQIEKEALALVFGVKRFHKYLYGRKFTLVTDHKPLLSILGPTCEVPSVAAARMQRWGIFLSAYQYDVEYKRSKEHCNADGLSRLLLSQTEDTSEIFCISFADALAVTADEIAAQTVKDPALSEVYHYVLEGWPQEVRKELKPLYLRREQLSTDQGCLLWGMRVIVPASLQNRMLGELHFTHPGVVKMKLLARSYIWWHRMDQDIEQLVSSCEMCAAHRSLPPKAPLHSWPWASNPMQRVHIDYAEIEGQQVLIIIDVHSKWIDAIPVSKPTANGTIDALRVFFANYGLPAELVSDNGPQFTAYEFREFCSNNGIKHSRTPPYHPASNGAAERAVQVVKQAVKKMGKQVPLNVRLTRFLLVYRTTPHSTTEMRPDVLFLRRHLRTRLTLTQPNHQPTVERHQQQQKRVHDRSSATVLFKQGQAVMVRNQRGKKQWIPGRIMCQKGPVTYLVRVDNRVRFCHADHLRKTNIKPMCEQEEQFDFDVASETPLCEQPTVSEGISSNPEPAIQETVSMSPTAEGVPPVRGMVTRHSSRIKQPTRRFIEEI